MKLLSEIKVKIGYNSDDVFLGIRKKYGIYPDEILNWEIVKESIDARKKPDVFMKKTAELFMNNLSAS